MGCGCEAQGRAVQMADQPDHLALSGVEEHVMAVELEEVRALKHRAAVDRVSVVSAASGSFEERMEVLPREEVGRAAVEEDGTALLRIAGADAQIPGVAIAPRCGITKSGDIQARGRRGQYRSGLLGEGAKVRACGDGEVLGLAKAGVAFAGGLVARNYVDAGVEGVAAAVMLDAAAAPATVLIRGVGRRGERDGKMSPVDEVR